MDSRTAARGLAQIAAYLELRGDNRFKIGAYEMAARAVQRLAAGDLRPLHQSGGLAATPRIGKGWCTAADVLNALSAEAVLQFARGRR